jgi:aryl-alcohol dehydrogenase-like predicted oxidoreductase
MCADIPRIELAPGYSISHVILGLWQLSGGHGSVDEVKVFEDIRRMVEEGLTTFDCADIYTGVEELIGRFRLRYQSHFQRGELPEIQVHTKYVPDLEALPSLSREYTETVIDRSLRRLGVECLDLVQFHWWDFDIPGHVEAVLHLAESQEAGKIRHLAVTNYDAKHLEEILQAGVRIVSNQVQYSVLDRRPEEALVELAREYGFRLLSYGTVAGGFLSDRYLREEAPLEPLENRSLTKYRLIIEEFGGWELFQDLLLALKSRADKYGVMIAEAAIRYIMQRPAVAGVIVGVRSGEHLERLIRLYTFELDDEDLDVIDEVLSQAQGPVGLVFGLERNREGEHGRIMKYDLNKIERSR